jgi:3D (Asp-Asp-Asp) domain-containing protein
MNYSGNRKIVKGYRDEVGIRLFMSWGLCILIGFVIGSIPITCLSESDQTPKEEMYIEEDETEIIRWKQDTEEVYVEELEIETTQQGSSLVSLGEFKLTAYCPCKKCCGKDDGITATGTQATQGRTVAVDPKVIPYGTILVINGHEYVAEDCGGSIKGNKIDVYFESHEEALEFGVQYKEIFLIEKKGESHD